MYDSLIALIQMLDNSEKKTTISITDFLVVKIELDCFSFGYNHEGISQAISILENEL